MNKMYTAVGVLALGLLALSFSVPLAMGTESHSYETHERDSNQYVSLVEPAAAGAGWFEVSTDSTSVRDYFVFELQSNQSVSDEDFLMFRATDISTIITSTNSTSVSVVNRTAEAWGWAELGGQTGYWFYLKATDGGLKSNDFLDLQVYEDANGNWKMDEVTPTYEWTANGLGGGDIAIGVYSPHNHESDEDHEWNESLNASAALGGGWFVGYNGTANYKVTFGMFVTTNESLAAYNSFVLQGRNVSERIQSLNFTKVELVNNTLDAWGWCKANGMPGYWFHLNVTDGGVRSNDTLSLAVYKDTNGNYTMDETSPTWQWNAAGLDGGNIYVGLLSEIPCDHEAGDYDSDD